MKSSFRALVASAAVKEISIFIFTPPKSFNVRVIHENKKTRSTDSCLGAILYVMVHVNDVR
ncbi:hypothetical protein DVH26_06525 [Paenibacillus sp. H1-7]|nr:hypothetical protein DVH26_06525 [Paenibacillus sp. H1-7]